MADVMPLRGHQGWRYVHLKEISVDFMTGRLEFNLRLVFKDDTGGKYESNKFKKGNLVIWNLDMYVRAESSATLIIRHFGAPGPFKTRSTDILVEFKLNEFVDNSAVELQDIKHRITVNLVCGRSQSLEDVSRVLDFRASTDLASMVPKFLKLPELAALLPSAFEQVCTVHYPAVHWLNDDILLGIFNCYRLDEKNRWNRRLGWCKLTHVCQRWRRLIYECSSYLGMHIRYTNGSPMVNTLDHLLLLPLVVSYSLDFFKLVPTVQKQDELGIYHTLQLRDRIRHIHLDLPPPILHKVLMLMDETFPILEHLSLSMFSTASGHLAHRLPLTLPNAFLASNLRHLILFDIGLPKRLRMLASTVSLVTLELRNIQTSSYFRPRLLVARLRSLPLLEKLTIEFFIPIPRPSTEMELLGEQRTPVTLPSLKILRFCGVGAYLESLVAQIRVPLLEELKIELFNQIAFVLPHLFDLINITEVFKLGRAIIGFYPHEVSVAINVSPGATPFDLCVRCMPLGWQFDSAAQICDALVPTLSSAEELSLVFDCHQESSTEMQNGAIDSASWHNLLRGFIGVKTLDIDDTLTEELSRVLQVDEVGSDSGFLPNLQSIHAEDNRFASFIDIRQAVGRPVEFFQLEVAPRSLPSSRPSSVVVSL